MLDYSELDVYKRDDPELEDLKNKIFELESK